MGCICSDAEKNEETSAETTHKALLAQKAREQKVVSMEFVGGCVAHGTQDEKMSENLPVVEKLQLLSQNQEATEQKEVSKEILDEVKSLATQISVFLPLTGKQSSVDIIESKKPKVKLLSSALEATGMNFQVVGKGEPSNLKNMCSLNAASTTLEVTFPCTGGSTWYDGNYESISTKPTEMQKFKSQFKAMIAESLGCYPREVSILRVSPSSVKVSYTIISDKLNMSNKAHIDKMNESIAGTIKEYTGKEVVTGYVEPCYKISPDDFDARGDIHFPTPDGSEQMRGGRKYYQPSNKWQRIGLRVLDIYDGPPGWLNMDGNKNEWAVAYHGIRAAVPYVISKTMKEHMRPGTRQAYRNGKTVDGQTVGYGIYCTPKLEVAEHGYTTVSKDLGTKVILQCRVRPAAIKDCGNDYWVINDPKDIRPYGLLIESAVKF